MGPLLQDLSEELALAKSAEACLDILGETPKHLGLQSVGFREQIDSPIALRLPDSFVWEKRFGWPTGFISGWLDQEHGGYFPIKQLMRNPDAPAHWFLAREQRGGRTLTKRQRSAVQYMLDFGICQGLTVPVALPFGRTGCITWFASDDRRHPYGDIQLIALLQTIAERFFDGIDRNRSWSPVSPLSQHEAECLYWAARGMSDKEIARLIERSADTSRFHIKSAIRKLDAVNRTHAVALAINAAFIEPIDRQRAVSLPNRN